MAQANPANQPDPGRRPRLEVLDTLTPAQSRVLAAVQEAPGLSIQQLAVRLRTSHATASYHLFGLGRLGLLVQVRDGREVRHFPGPAQPHSTAYLEALLRDGRKARLLSLLAFAPVERMTIHQMAKAAGLTFSFAKRTLAQLEWADLVLLERRRHRYTVRVHPARRLQLQGMLAGADAQGGAALPRGP